MPKEEVCIAKDGIVNLLSMGKLVKEVYCVQMDSDVDNAINVFNEDSSYIKFLCVNDGLYCINLEASGEQVNCLTTVSEQKGHFSDADNKRADLARYLQECLCLPSDKDFAAAIDTGEIKECGIDKSHIKIANIIHGPAKAAIEGKTIQRTNKMPRDSGLITNLPPSILERYGMVTLGLDVMHINNHPFILSVSKHIKHFQYIGTRNKSIKTFLSTIDKMKAEYMMRGFVLKMIYANRAFATCETELNKQSIQLVCCDTNAHEQFVERGICFVKERIRCVRSMLPSEIIIIPSRLMRELVVSTVKMINSY